MAERLHLQPKHRQMLESLLRKHLPEVEVWAYGSRVTGRSHDGSDLDLVLRGPGLEKIPVGQLADFEEAVRESNIPFLVEARDWARLPERFHREIGRCHVLLLSPDQSKGEIGEWSERKWRDIATLEYGKGLRGEMRPGLVPVFGTNGQIGWHDTPLCQHPGVVVGRKGAYRGIHYSPVPFHVIDTAFYLRPTVDLDARWAYFNLLTQDINGMDSGSAIPSTSREEFYSLPVSVPPLDEQRAIAHVLGTLDDKIELNRHMNETLEATARALFKSWFVDFEPVRANMAGRKAELPQTIANLFPTKFDQVESSDVPAGWDTRPLAEIATAGRQNIVPADFTDETPYIGLEHMPQRSIALGSWGLAEGIKSAKTRFQKGDILFGKLRPYFHKVGIAPVDGVCSTDIVVIAPRSPEWSAFVAATVSSDQFVSHADRTSTGTRMPRTSWKSMSQYPICIPPSQLALAYQEAVQPVLDKIVVNIHSNVALTSLRDALLPKLVSGEIRIADAEKAVESVI